MSELINMELVLKEVLETNKKQADKRLSFFNDLFVKLRRGNRESVDALRVIEKNYQAELALEKEMFNLLKTNIEGLENELKVSLDNFNKNFNIENETLKLANNKEKGLMPKTQIYRKETHDVTFKSDRLLKEEKDTLKEKQEAFEEFENTYRNKIQDLEKRLRYEVNKIKNSTLNEYDDLQKSLLNNNNRKEIKQINKKIEEIRKVGIKSEKDIRLQYLKEIELVEIEYTKLKKDALVEINNIKKDFNIKKLELESERKIINLNYQIELDRYDFGSRRAINNLKQKMLLKKNAVILNQFEKIKNVSLEYQKEQREKIEYKRTISKDFIEVMDNNYKAFDETLKVGTVLLNNVYFEQIDAFKVYLHNGINHAYSLFVCLHDEYVNNVIANEYETLKLFVNAKYNYEALCHRDFSVECNRLNELYEKFVNDIKVKSNIYNERVQTLFDNMTETVNSLIESIKSIWNETNIIDSFHLNIRDELNNIIASSNKYLDDSYLKESNTFVYVDEQINKFNNTMDYTSKENNDMALEHKSVEEIVENEMNVYHQEKENERQNIANELKDLILKEEEEAKNNEKSYVDDMNSSLQNIALKKANDIKEIENDYKTQMNLLK